MNSTYTPTPINPLSSPLTTNYGATGAQPGSNFLSRLFQTTPYPVMILISVLVLVLVIVFIVFKVKANSLASVDLLTNPIVPGNPLGGEFNIAPAGKLPNTNNGNQYSYSVWLFVDNVSITEDHKTVLYRGNSQSYANGTFFVYMDAKTNSLYASVRTNGALDETNTNVEPTLNDIKKNKYFLQSLIDYIPLQRWVNVTYTVNDTVLSTFMDGDLYSVTSIYELPVKADGSRPLISKQQGDVNISGKAGKEGFNGYIGNSKYYNFALTVTEAQVVYKKGPYKLSWLSYLGLTNVGVRSPIYTIHSDTALQAGA